jgi:hypothetical protein
MTGNIESPGCAAREYHGGIARWATALGAHDGVDHVRGAWQYQGDD